MQRSPYLVLGALAFVSLTGFQGGCGPLFVGPPDSPPRSGTTGSGSGGSSGTSGSNGSTGDDWSCSTLSEPHCLVRSDCQPVYADGCAGQPVFERCQDRVCAEVASCAIGCTVIAGPDGCPTCSCSPQGCSSDADCPSGDYCQQGGPGSGDGCGAPPPTTRGQCLPLQVCPELACAPADPTWICTTGTDANGCPSCQCQPAGCQSDADCGPGTACRPLDCNSIYCNHNECLPESCQADGDCRTGEVCSFGCGPCDPSTGACPDCTNAGGRCQAAPVTPCTADGDCALGQTCQPDPADPCNQPGMACDALRASTICLPAPVCSSAADCQSGEVCGPSPIDPCHGTPGCSSITPTICQGAPANCGQLTCGSDQVCVHTEGGAMLDDAGVGSWYRCDAYPQACATVADCGCVGQAICGSPSGTTCDASGVTVNCYVP